MADMRYVNQTVVLSVILPEQKQFDDLTVFSSGFHRMHQERYGFSFDKDPVEMVALKVRAVGNIPTMKPEEIEKGKNVHIKANNQREIRFPLLGKSTAQVFERSSLRAGNKISGPAAIEENTCSTVIPPDMEAVIDNFGCIVINLQ